MDIAENELKDIYDKSNAKSVSCGFLVIDTNTGKMVAAHATDSPSDLHDILKGHLEPGETYIEAALRELKEESGIVLDPNEPTIVDCGKHSYTREKDIYVFKVEIPVNIEELHCDSMFTDPHGIEKPEMDGFILTDNIEDFYKSLQPVLRKVLSIS